MAVTASGTRVLEKRGQTELKKNGTTTDTVTTLQKAHVRNLSRLVNLSVPVMGGTTTAATFGSTVEEILAHGATTTLFGEIFALIQKDELTREELDHKLVNWVLRVPGVQARYDKLSEDMKRCVEEFKVWGGKARDRIPGTRGFKKPMSPVSARRMEGMKLAWEEQCKVDGGKKYPAIVENTGEPVIYVEKLVFKNWGETVESTPALTFVPKSVVGVQNIVRYAKLVNKKIRVSGYRHTWTDMFPDDNEILISNLPIDTAVDLPSIEGSWHPGEGLLQQIQPLPNTVAEDGSSILCKVGTATTNQQFHDWCVSQTTPLKWTIPLNVIMMEITFGGSFSPVCHGAGLGNKTLPDLVEEVEYVDVNGEVRTVSDPVEVKAAAGAFGLLGVVTALTIRLPRMTYAAMRPRRVPLELAVPPPKEYIDAARAGDPRYKSIKDLIEQHSQETLDKALQDFIQSAETDYYAEWFWFPLQRDVWVNCWQNNGFEAQSRTIPDEFETFLEWLEEWIAEEVNNWAIYQILPGEFQAKILGFLTMLQLPNVTEGKPPMTTELINGLHFRRGIQNMQCVSVEWEIPIPAQPLKRQNRHSLPASLPTEGPLRRLSKRAHRKMISLSRTPDIIPPATFTQAREETARQSYIESGDTRFSTDIKRDWTITQKAWWDTVLQMQANPSVVRVALEMRVMGHSDIIMAPQRGNVLGTTAIEILTTFNTPPDEWQGFCQKIVDKWISYRDRSTGKRLHVRPHWCKQWSFLSLPDEHGAKLKAPEWMREVAYKDEIPEFLGTLRKIGERDGFRLEDLRNRFANAFLGSVFWGGKEVVERVVESDDPAREKINRFKKWLKKLFS